MTMSHKPTCDIFYVLQRFLGDYSKTRFLSDDVKEAVANFKTALQNIADSIQARNASLALPYTYLLPECIPAGITI